jgi:hypothetical protein
MKRDREDDDEEEEEEPVLLPPGETVEARDQVLSVLFEQRNHRGVSADELLRQLGQGWTADRVNAYVRHFAGLEHDYGGDGFDTAIAVRVEGETLRYVPFMQIAGVHEEGPIPEELRFRSRSVEGEVLDLFLSFCKKCCRPSENVKVALKALKKAAVAAGEGALSFENPGEADWGNP